MGPIHIPVIPILLLPFPLKVTALNWAWHEKPNAPPADLISSMYVPKHTFQNKGEHYVISFKKTLIVSNLDHALCHER